MGSGKKQVEWNRDEIKYHLRSAVDSLVPDVLDKIDLNVPREEVQPVSKIRYLHRRAKVYAAVAAACLCLVVGAQGLYHVSNLRVDSVIGIDVNPSIELSINRKNKVLKAEPLTEDARIVMDGMELDGVDLNVAVNAIIGSMVKQGYFDHLDNAILVTVSNDDEAKASDLRQVLVGDIEASLEENQVQAVVYDQQAIAQDEVSAMAEEYGISYGKAYFLKELMVQNESLTESHIREFASMNMEEIAREIAEGSYIVGKTVESESTEAVAGQTTSEVITTEESTTSIEATTTLPETTTALETTNPPLTTAPTTVPETTTASTEETTTGGRVKIDNVDFEDGILDISFEVKVRWKDPTISVRDSDGASYSAKFIDTSQNGCTIEVDQIQGGKRYSFTIGGVAPKSGGNTGMVNGKFEAPEISSDATEAIPDTSEESSQETSEGTVEASAAESQTPTETVAPPTQEESKTEPETSQTESQVQTQPIESKNS